MKRAKLGQSTVEYVIILAIIIGLIVAIMGSFKGKVGSAYNGLHGKIQTAVE